MSYNATTTVGGVASLLVTISLQYEELLLIGNVNKFFNVDHNILLLESSINVDRFVCATIDTPKNLFTFRRLGDGISVAGNVKNVKSKSSFLVVVSAESNFAKNANLFAEIKKIQVQNIDMKIGLFFPHTNVADLRELFEWSWNHRIVNIFVALNSHRPDDSFNIFKYSPFGALEVMNVTSSGPVESFFPSKISNFKQHPIRLGIYSDIWVFQYSVKDQRIGGPDGKLWTAMLRHLNASFTIIVERAELWRMLKSSTIDIIPFSHRNLESQLAYLYPVNMETEVIAVPEALPFPEYVSYLRSITSADFFGYSAVTIATTVALLITIRYIERKKIFFFQCFADVMNLLMNDNGSIKYRRLFRAEVFLIVPLTFAGFVIVNGFLSSLQSYVTHPIMMSQIDTVEDIYQSPFPIVTVSSEWSTELPDVLANISNHGGWKDKVYLRKIVDVLPQLFRYNTTMSALLFKTHVNILLKHQKRLNIRGYYIPNDFYILKFLSSYHVNIDFPFMERFNDIIHRMQSAGLYEKWTGELYNEVKDKSFSTNRSDYFGAIDRNEIESFPIPKFIIYGWIVGVVVLIFEIILKKFFSRKRYF